MPLSIIDNIDNHHGVCSRCEDNCCHMQDADREDSLAAALSFSDLVRIQEHTGVHWAKFATLAPRPDDASMEALRRLHPELAVLYEGDKFAHLKFEGGACVLLKNGRCSLPMDVRPRICALYPLWFRRDGGDLEVTAGEVSSARKCQAIEEAGRDVKEVIKLFNVDEGKLERLVKVTRAEILDHAVSCKEATKS